MPDSVNDFFGNFDNSVMGQNGVRFFDSETPKNGNDVFKAIVFDKESIFSAKYIPKNDRNETDTVLTDKKVPAGYVLIGRWSNFVMKKGEAIAYK